MIKIFIPENNLNLLNDLTDLLLEDVCIRIFKIKDYIVVNEQRRVGRYIRLINDETNEIHVVCFSNYRNDSRNARLMQFVSPAYVEYYNLISDNKHIDVYLVNQASNDETDYIKMFYRCFLTIGISILNLEDLPNIVPFTSYEDVKSYRNQTSVRNSHNRSTYFTDDNNQISIYGKTFGANAMESFIFALTILKIVDRPVVFYPVLDNESVQLSQEQVRIMSESGISYGSIIDLLPSGYARPTRNSSRNQSVFKYNLLQKYGDQQCYLCGCNLEHLIIASHIERVTDIDKNESYSLSHKAERSTDGDNGLWLCASHDKMFEYGVVYFEEKVLKVKKSITNQQQKDFIQASIFKMRQIYYDNSVELEVKIKSEHYSHMMQEYLSKHTERLSNTI